MQEYESIINGSQHYSMLDNPIYRVCIEDSKHPGYVKVRCIDDPSIFSTKTLSTADRLSPQAISEGEEETLIRSKENIL